MLNDDISYLSDSTNTSIYAGRGNWGIEWMNRNPNADLTKLSADNICDICEHSMGTYEGETKDNSRLHCVLKGLAAWWMWAVLAGWTDGLTVPTGIEKKSEIAQEKLNNYPNPFKAETIISYEISQNAHVKIELFNAKGQKIKVLLDKNQMKGKYQLPVQINDKEGIYFYTLSVNNRRTTKQMLKIK